MSEMDNLTQNILKSQIEIFQEKAILSLSHENESEIMNNRGPPCQADDIFLRKDSSEHAKR